MSHPTYVISLSPQAKWYVLIGLKYLIPLTCLKLENFRQFCSNNKCLVLERISVMRKEGQNKDIHIPISTSIGTANIFSNRQPNPGLFLTTDTDDWSSWLIWKRVKRQLYCSSSSSTWNWDPSWIECSIFLSFGSISQSQSNWIVWCCPFARPSRPANWSISKSYI